MIYLDYAAATPLDEQVLEAMQPYFSDVFFNPSATYMAARQAHQALETARTSVAHWLGARPSEIVFTAGGTEANNLAIHGIMRQFPQANLVVSSVEHESVLAPAAQYDMRQAAVASDGRLKQDSLKKQINEHTVLVSIMYANNEVGTIQPLRETAQLIKNIRDKRRQSGNTLPLYLHSDAAQAGNYLDLHTARLGVDLMTVNGGKLYGPKQSGALYVRAGVRLLPLVQGGGQERGLRSGTENVAGAVGLARALEIAQEMRRKESARLLKLQKQFAAALPERLPEAIINGSTTHRLPNNIHLTLPGQDNERLLFGLDEAGILAAAGSACSASNEEPSHVLRAMGISKSNAQASLRFTLGRSTSAADIESTIKALGKLLS